MIGLNVQTEIDEKYSNISYNMLIIGLLVLITRSLV